MREATVVGLLLSCGCVPFPESDMPTKGEGNAMILVDAKGLATSLLYSEETKLWRVLASRGDYAGSTGSEISESQVWSFAPGTRRAQFSTKNLFGARGPIEDPAALLAGIETTTISLGPPFMSAFSAYGFRVCGDVEYLPSRWWFRERTDPWVQLRTACSRPNQHSSALCVELCTPVCGDSYLDNLGGEQCDPPGPHCSEDCVGQWCGNGIVDPGEECDDGRKNGGPPNTCRPSCKLPRCGDGTVDEGEECDPGSLPGPREGCANNCHRASCGDSWIQFGEGCDDGNMIDADECSATCKIPPGTPMFTVSSATVSFSVTPGLSPIARSGTINLGDFDFRFLGHRATSIFFGDASLYFGPVVTREATIIAPGSISLWDAKMAGTVASSTTTGQAPNRVLAIGLEISDPHDSRVDIEVRLHESTDLIEVFYAEFVRERSTYFWRSDWSSLDGGRGGKLLACSPSCNTATWPSNTGILLTPYEQP